jgi:HTH-type transcriptional regulator/antitoxin HigA
VGLDSLAQLPDLLIRARVAAGLTRLALAERLGLEEYQVSHCEETRHADVGLDRLRAVAETLGLRRQARVTLPAAAPTPGES